MSTTAPTPQDIAKLLRKTAYTLIFAGKKAEGEACMAMAHRIEPPVADDRPDAPSARTYGAWTGD